MLQFAWCDKPGLASLPAKLPGERTLVVVGLYGMCLIASIMQIGQSVAMA